MTSSQIIARFNYENKIFCISLSKDRKIKYSYLDDKGETYFDLKKDEIELVTDVFKMLLVDEKNSSYVRDEKINNNAYQIFYDPKTKNYFWKSNTGELDVKDNIFFNMKYNNMPSVVYSYKDNFDLWKRIESDLGKEYRKEVFDRKRKKFVSILVNAGLSLTFITSIAIMINGYNFGINSINEIKPETSIVEVAETQYTTPAIIEATDEEIESIKEENNYSWEKIKQAIESNPNLSGEEKAFLYKLQFVFDENHQYMNLDMVIARLETLEIKYIAGYDKESNGSKGLYNSNDNKIKYYYVNSFKEVNINVFLHEFFHVLQGSSSRFLKELSNEVFTREVIRRLHTMGELDEFNIMIKTDEVYNYGDGYDDYIFIYYYLAELFSQEDLQRYQFECDENYLISSLEITKDTNLVWWDLIDTIDILNPKYGYGSYFILLTQKEEIKEKFSKFYQLNGMSLNENANCFANDLSFSTRFSSSDGEFLLASLEKSHYMEYDDIMMFHTNIQMKTYFSNTFPETTIHCEFTGRGINSKNGNQILKDNGDYNKNYVINVDEEFEIAYSNYMSNSSKAK